MTATLSRLRCPRSGQALRRDNGHLVSLDGRHRYPLTESGIPLFAERPGRPESRIQQAHYDRIASIFVESLDYPHTRAYGACLDRALLAAIGSEPLGVVAELCCGRGEAIRLLREHRPDDVQAAIGVDISGRMLEAARRDLDGDHALLVQGDATALPLADESVDSVLVLGGIHHVNDRAALFGEVVRVLRPGGRFLWREPVNDLFAWRWLRAAIYRLSPTLNAATEHPLRRRETIAALRRAGLDLVAWRTRGFLGFCLLMNSDVLVVNRLLRFVPGIRGLARAAARLDDLALRLPGLRHAGLQVIGVARKPHDARHGPTSCPCHPTKGIKSA